jgi:hypothetical protein
MWTRLAVLPALLAVAIVAASPVTGQEQASPVICRTNSCSVSVDWGADPTPTFLDRRFGAPADLEKRVVAALTAAGYLVRSDPGASGFRIRIRPTLIQAMCDRLPGTSPDMSCRTFGEVRADFLDADPAWKLPGNLRVRNRCGSDDLMDVEKFSAYVAAMIDYTLARDKDRKRPTARC